MKYWLFKTEPDVFSIDDLKASPMQTTGWDGVRNYQARNMLRDEIRVGDHVLIHHSNADPSAVVGIAKVVKNGYPDPTAFDPKDAHYDPKSKQESPTWFQVDIAFHEKFPRALSLAELRAHSALSGMVLLQKGSRLSVQPVTPEQYRYVVKLAKKKV